MGDTISPVLAWYVMDDLLDVVIPTLPFNLSFIKKYVDEIILVHSLDGTSCIVDHISDYDEHI